MTGIGTLLRQTCVADLVNQITGTNGATRGVIPHVAPNLVGDEGPSALPGSSDHVAPVFRCQGGLRARTFALSTIRSWGLSCQMCTRGRSDGQEVRSVSITAPKKTVVQTEPFWPFMGGISTGGAG